MNRRDFEFITQQRESTAIEIGRKVTFNGRSESRPSSSAPETSPPIISDDDRFLRIVKKTSRIASHRELFELLQSEAIQRVLPHQVLISAWDNFDRPNLQYDVISSIPGLRTALVAHCTIDSLLNDLRQRWLSSQQQPLLLDSSLNIKLPCSTCAADCALHKFLQGNWSLLVHGFANVRDDKVSLYLAFNANPIINGTSIKRFRLLVDPLITQLDVAFRRIAALKSPGLPEAQESPTSLINLSRREKEILQLVSEGKSNIEISKTLAISLYTVKNHLKRIMKKLNSPNRTSAVAHFRPLSLKR